MKSTVTHWRPNDTCVCVNTRRLVVSEWQYFSIVYEKIHVMPTWRVFKHSSCGKYATDGKTTVTAAEPGVGKDPLH
jgi:hypothetical protein